jgi:hypothetical protein
MYWGGGVIIQSDISLVMVIVLGDVSSKTAESRLDARGNVEVNRTVGGSWPVLDGNSNCCI